MPKPHPEVVLEICNGRTVHRLKSLRPEQQLHYKPPGAAVSPERKLAHGLDLHGILDLRQHSRADEDLTWLGLIAKARGNIGHRPNSGIVETAFKPDSTERSEAVCYPDAEANVVAPSAPRFCQGSDSVTHFKRHEHSLERRVLYRHRIVEDHHHAVASVPLKRAVVFDDDFANGRMVVAQQSPSRLPRQHFQ